MTQAITFKPQLAPEQTASKVDAQATTAGGKLVETRELVKRYGSFTAVDGLNLEIEQGEIFGLLGPNGAGKTTTILMMMGLTEPTSGYVRVLGFDPVRQPIQVKRVVGYLPERVAMYDDLSARENLMYTADLNGLSYSESKARVRAALEQVGLAHVADKKVRTFSHGMRQRLGIADVLIKKPQLVILDEPTLGLDPEAVNQILELIVEMTRAERLTVLLSSHQLQQVQRICSRVGIFVKGKMVAQGSIHQLAEQLAGGVHQLQVRATLDGSSEQSDKRIVETLKRVPGVLSVEPENGYWRVRATRDVRPELARALTTNGWSLYHLSERDFGLEEIYLKYFQS